MRVGLDFDNTIVDYDALFHRVALERGLISPDVGGNKLAVRDHLRDTGREDAWTELQGYVYGARMDEAPPYDGMIAFAREAWTLGHELFIVSHKTRFPFLGPQYDLHDQARSWIDRHLTYRGEALLPTANVFFELTKAEKIVRITSCEVDVFMDDLPEILLAPNFPSRTGRWLFDPEGRHAASGMPSFRDWYQVATYLKCQTTA